MAFLSIIIYMSNWLKIIIEWNNQMFFRIFATSNKLTT